MVASALGLGLYAATHRAYLTELQDRATRLELERDQREALAAAAERARLTRDMHDILAHNLAVIVALSDGAAAAVATTPERAAEAMRTVSSTGRQALSDIRRLLGASPDDPSAASRHPAPDIHGLEALVETVRAAGLPVTYEVQGSRAALDPSAQVTVYRLVQEALTNSLKHGGHGTTATVRLHYLPGEVHLDIEDDGAGAAAPAPDTLGRGLSGMRERVHAFNGALQSGPRSPRGWRVSATLRVDEAAR
jgi:signal transduction histidine kinase